MHAGLTPATPNQDFQAPLGIYGYDPNLATDATSRTMLAWYSNAAGHLGLLAQDVAADGAPVGSPLTMPNTAAMGTGMLGRTPLVARRGGGFYAAYPTPNVIRVWRIGASNAPRVGRVPASGSPAVAIAAADQGRLWVLWTRGFGDPDVIARRSNKGATRFGAPVDAGHPKDAAQAYKLGRQRRRRRARRPRQLQHRHDDRGRDLVRRILPGLTLKARPGRVRKGEDTDVRFTVLDAGDAVKGAR